MPRAGLNRNAVVDIAMTVVDEEGPEMVTLAAVAKRAGVATPSLYKHVENVAVLRSLLARRAMVELAERLGDAAMGRSGDDAVGALMHAYRSYVVDHPARYHTIPAQPKDDPLLAEPADRTLDMVLAALRAYDLSGEDLIHAARCLRSAVHGFAVLEAAGGFGLPADLDTSYHRLVAMTLDGIRTPADTGSPQGSADPGQASR